MMQQQQMYNVVVYSAFDTQAFNKIILDEIDLSWICKESVKRYHYHRSKHNV